MNTAVDSSVILSIYKNEPAGILWLEKLAMLRKISRLVVCEIVVSETRPVLSSDAAHQTQLTRLGIHFLPISFAASCRAGQILQAYRDAGTCHPPSRSTRDRGRCIYEKVFSTASARHFVKARPVYHDFPH